VLWPSPIIQGVFLHRRNRFTLEVQVGNEMALCHLANSGRLGELLVKGRRVWLHPAEAPERKTAYDLILVETAEGHRISIDARVPNALFAEAFRDHRLQPFSGFTALRAEVTVGESRLDFQLDNDRERCFVEVKSVTLVDRGVARFPDAPTERGRKHLNELMRLKAQGLDAAVVFMVQRSDAHYFSPNDRTDPAFGETLRRAHAAGVLVLAYGCTVLETGIDLLAPVEVRL